MSVAYRAVNWNPQKKLYDAVLVGGIVAALLVFGAATILAHPSATIETVLIRGTGFTGLLLLHVILAIGPLARLDRRFLPLLYNRRHLGVALGVLGAAHAGLIVFQYHALGNVNPFVSLLASNTDLRPLRDVPFEWFGIAALLILGLMAATSHDYWLSVLTPPVWKRLHMLVYLAYVALIWHVGLGFLQDQVSPLYPLVLGAGVVGLGLLHLLAASRERPADTGDSPAEWVDVGAAAAIAEGRACVGLVAGERVAVFRHENRLSAVSNVCKHQNGPLGEGRIIDGCITCPWHGYQYRPDSGTSPPPFDDSIPTFRLRVVDGRVQVHHQPLPAGTRVEPVPVDGPAPRREDEFYVGYLPEAPPATGRFERRAVVTILLLATAVLSGFGVAQANFDQATFEFGVTTALEGTVRESPYPLLEVAGDDGRTRSYLLAAAGKHGARSIVSGHGGARMRLEGSLAYRDHLTLLEVASIEPAEGPAGAAPAPEDLGTYRLEGEIVDSKCYTGVMNPGRGKTHRGCAARCLSGGLTPLFVTRNRDGGALELIVVGRGMAPRYDLAGRAGRRLEVTGRVWRQADLWFLQLDGS